MELLPTINAVDTPSVLAFMRFYVDAMLWGMLVGLFIRLIRRGSD